MPKIQLPQQEHRKFIRLNSVFPVQFRFLELDREDFLSEWLQGFTSNVSGGGICLAINNLDAALAGKLKSKAARLSLLIEMPITERAIPAVAQIAWVYEVAENPNKYLVGLNYEKIDLTHSQRIIRYARMKKIFFPVVIGVIFILGLILTLNARSSVKLTHTNRILVEQLIQLTRESVSAKQKIKAIAEEKEALRSRIQALRFRFQAIAEEKAKTKARSKRIAELNAQVEALIQKKISLEEALNSLQGKEAGVAEKISRIDKAKGALEKENLKQMYCWLVTHQNPSTGLVMSFEGDEDIKNWAFTYDQSLAAQAYILFKDFERAKKVLDFFQKKAKRQFGMFLNAYYFNDGEPAEYTIHSGPNIWLGIAAAQYTRACGDRAYLCLAEDIAQNIISLQNRDPEGGIRGGPSFTWYSTEHNLDAYAFLDMLYVLTAQEQYAKARDGVLNWIVKHTYDLGDIPIKRGKGDSTIATDTYAWSIAAIGPQKLEEINMDPERIMEFAEQSSGVEVSYTRPDAQTVKIRGFDFAPQRNLARGGIVSSEWTAQMVIAFKVMADFYAQKGLKDKADSYALKAEEYLAGLSNMIISSPSPSGQGESCLPYATAECVDTGHGWFTPKGKSTGSVAGTACTLFAYYNYNPLKLQDKDGQKE